MHVKQMVTQRIEIPSAPDKEKYQSFSQEISSPEFVAELLVKMGVSEKEDAREFFLTSESSYLPPEDLKGLTDAVQQLIEIKNADQKIVVHGDYDVDGTAGTAVLYSGLKKCGLNVQWFLPNRFNDGYGLTVGNVEKFHEEGVQWIITVDTGINAYSEIKRAKELGMGVIITDHHQPGDEIPVADIIVNPNQPGCEYPNKQLCGAGVAYKLMDALCRELTGEGCEDLLTFVALASLADIVQMKGENRYMVRKGLRSLQQGTKKGLKMLIQKTGLSGKSLSSMDILFKVTPLLNAAGRLSSSELTLKLFLCEEQDEAILLVEQLHQLNQQRKQLDKEATEEALKIIDSVNKEELDACMVMASPDWHEGIIGIVAAKLAEKFCRPAFVMSISGDTAKGSGRTVKGFHLHKALGENQDLLGRWGGHYYACGFSMPAKNIDTFREKMSELADKYLTEESREKVYKPDVMVPLKEINADALVWLQRFEPTGPGNEVPMFISENVYVYGSLRIVGGSHLKFEVTDGKIFLDAIAFGMGHLKESLNTEVPLRIVFYPEWNTFLNQKNIQLRIVAMENMY